MTQSLVTIMTFCEMFIWRKLFKQGHICSDMNLQNQARKILQSTLTWHNLNSNKNFPYFPKWYLYSLKRFLTSILICIGYIAFWEPMSTKRIQFICNFHNQSANIHCILFDKIKLHTFAEFKTFLCFKTWTFIIKAGNKNI